jgi:hypothetical protein
MTAEAIKVTIPPASSTTALVDQGAGHSHRIANRWCRTHPACDDFRLRNQAVNLSLSLAPIAYTKPTSRKTASSLSKKDPPMLTRSEPVERALQK